MLFVDKLLVNVPLNSSCLQKKKKLFQKEDLEKRSLCVYDDSLSPENAFRPLYRFGSVFAIRTKTLEEADDVGTCTCARDLNDISVLESLRFAV